MQQFNAHKEQRQNEVFTGYITKEILKYTTYKTCRLGNLAFITEDGLNYYPFFVDINEFKQVHSNKYDKQINLQNVDLTIRDMQKGGLNELL
jgi:hypothetical protein